MIAIRSISMDSQYKNQMSKMTGYLLALSQKIGLQHAQLIPTAGQPIFYADFLAAGSNQSIIRSTIQAPLQPTILIYCHYDVQPAENENAWQSDPFVLTEKNGKLYGRGVADNKGEIALLFAVLEELIAKKQLKTNIKLLFEGEEEVGSPNIQQTLATHQDLFQADAAIILDETMPTPDQPVLYTSLRGLISLEVTVETHSQDLHSGVYGGQALNAVQELAYILSKAKDPQTKTIKIPGFYDQVVDLIPPKASEAEYSDEELGTIRPTFEINGMVGGYTGDGLKTIIPAKALAKITCRLVANQEPATELKKLKNWFLGQQKPGVKIKLKEVEASASPVYVETDNQFVKKTSQLMHKIFANSPQLIKSGATVGAAGDIQAEYQIPLLLFGFPLDDCHMHSFNENIDLEVFAKAYQFLSRFFADWGTIN